MASNLQAIASNLIGLILDEYRDMQPSKSVCSACWLTGQIDTVGDLISRHLFCSSSPSLLGWSLYLKGAPIRENRWYLTCLPAALPSILWFLYRREWRKWWVGKRDGRNRKNKMQGWGSIPSCWQWLKLWCMRVTLCGRVWRRSRMKENDVLVCPSSSGRFLWTNRVQNHCLPACLLALLPKLLDTIRTW